MILKPAVVCLTVLLAAQRLRDKWTWEEGWTEKFKETLYLSKKEMATQNKTKQTRVEAVEYNVDFDLICSPTNKQISNPHSSVLTLCVSLTWICLHSCKTVLCEHCSLSSVEDW